MDFSWSATQDELYRKTLAFARERLEARAPSNGGRPHFARAAWRRCGEFGLLGLCAPEEYGGMGLDAVDTARIIEAFGRGCEDGGLVFSASAHLFACVRPLVAYGRVPLKAQLLPELCQGAHIGANAITEAEAGSDVFALKTTARREGDQYVLNGAKSYVTNGPVADVIVVYANTNPSHGYLGVTAFAVKTDAPGLTVGKPFQKMGLSSSPISTVYLEGCRIPASARLGEEGQGPEVFAHSMQWERACLFAGYLGSMERQLERTIEFAKQRRQFRRPLGKHQAVAHRIADMKLRLEAARLLLYRACWTLDRGGDASMEVSLAKLAVSEAAVQSGLDTIQLHGGMGFITETGAERILRDAIPSTIFSGTSEIQRDLIANRLGL